MHPQRTDFNIRPHSELLDTVADWHTGIREGIVDLRADTRAGRWRQAAITAGVAGLAFAAAVGVVVLLGWALAAGLGWAAGHAIDGVMVAWDQVAYPVLAAPINSWFAAHADGFGYNPHIVMAVWFGLGALLWLAASLRSRAGIAMFIAWLGWAGASTAIVYTGAAAADSILSAGIAATTTLVLSIVPIIQIPPPPLVHVISRESHFREKLAELNAAVTAAHNADDHATARRLQRELRGTLAELYPEPEPIRSDEHERARMHQGDREDRALPLVIAAATLGVGVLLFGMSGAAFPAVVAGLAAVTLAIAVALPSADEVFARRLQRERDEQQRREADEAVLAEAERTLRSVPLDGGDEKK